MVFTLTVVNDGPSDATGVEVTDQLPTGYTYSDNSPSQGTYVSGTGVWTIGNINVGQVVTLTITATVNASGDYDNYTQVTDANETDDDSVPNDDSSGDDDDDTQSTTPTPIIDLELDKAVDDTTPNVGDDVVFTLTVVNDGPSDATGVEVTDQLPTGYTYSDDSPSQGTYISGTGLWTIGDIDVGQVVTLTITATVNASGDYDNYTQVTDANETDSDSVPNDDSSGDDDDDSVSVSPVSIIDLELDKVVNTNTPNVGEVVTFTITVVNDGPANATGVEVTDQLPSGYTYGGASTSQGTYVPGTGVWTIGNLVNNTVATLTITATVNASGDYDNVAEVTNANETDSDSVPNNDDGDQSEDDEDNAVITPQQADLSLTKSVDDSTPAIGDEVIFTITLTNDGPDTATNIFVEDVIPTGLTYVGFRATSGAYNPFIARWTVNSLANGLSETLTITATISSAGRFTNTAQVNAVDQHDIDSTPDNDNPNEDDQDEATLTAEQADLSLVKNVDNSTPNVGDDVVFTLTLSNAGPDDATNVTVSDVLPAGLTFVSSSASQGSYSDGTGVWTVGTVPNGGSHSLTITATVNSASIITNTAQVTDSDQNDPNSDPNNDNGDQSEDDEDNAVITPQQVDLSLTKDVDNSTPNVGDNVVFTIILSNAGPSDATNVAVEDVLPAGLTFVSSSASQGSYNDGIGIWTVGTVVNGGSHTLTITAPCPVQATTSTSLRLMLSLIKDVDQNDPNSTPDNDDPTEDDQDQATVDIPLGPALAISKMVNIARLAPNQAGVVTYTLTVTNVGNTILNPVAVTDTLPAGLSYVLNSANPAPTSVNGQELVWSDIASGTGLAPGQQRQITLLVNVPLDIGAYVNIARAEGTYPGGIATDEDEVTLVVEDPAVDLNKQVVAPGVVDGHITFTIQITNTGPSTIDVLPLFDTFSGPVEYVGGVPTADLVDNATGQLAWNDLTQVFGDVNPGQMVTITTIFRLTTEDTEFSLINNARTTNALDTAGNTANDDDDAVVLNNYPTAVELLYFRAEPDNQHIRLEWATAVEYDNFGFRLLRSQTENLADAVELTFVPGQGLGTVGGATYGFRDETIVVGQNYTYWLVDVDLDGVETLHGPVSLTSTDANSGGQDHIIYMPVIVIHR